ncbi:uroporphyrinogen-III synthase [Bacillus sp. 1NLA3E]|uniref:uroporphyrinogen-III synthase n=1 Tax=Bacillus sp. 1NLA3E TaxID=666686 RepID=UPI000247EB01|nr:uroporphyrinogen-III synthase [Bacillus sp. 1NLA3E]AGK55103.1 uroporphyrinogen-III synthase [Bacillus sp. 1NLA3E]
MTASSLPLYHKKVLVPRGKGQAKPFSDLVKKNGGIPIEIPLIAFRPVQLNDKLKEMITKLHTYDWIIFTSNVTVDTFLSMVNSQTLPKVAVIGARTKQVLEERGIPVAFTPSEYVAEGFVSEFLPLIQPGMKVLIPKGNLARDYIALALTEHGAIVTESVIYETYAPEESKKELAEMLSNEELDILTFTSPSTVDHFIEIVQEYNLSDKLKSCLVACIGPVSTKRAKALGLTVHVSPTEYTVKDMIKAIIENLNQVTR